MKYCNICGKDKANYFIRSLEEKNHGLYICFFCLLTHLEKNVKFKVLSKKGDINEM